MLEVLSTPAFLEKALLLILTALLSGLLVPIVLRQIDERKTIEQMQRQASLARQSKLIDSQADLLSDLARTLWNWRYAAMRVTYYGAQGNAEALREAWRSYTEAIWATLSDFRFHASRSRWLISARTFNSLNDLYGRLVSFDMDLYRAFHQADPIRNRLELGDLNRHIFEVVTSDIDTLLEQVAREVMLAVHGDSDPRMGRRTR